MHELSIAHGIVESVEDALRGGVAGGGQARVTRVLARVGALGGVVPDALASAWEVASAGTSLDGAALDIELVPAAVYCDACDRIRELDDPTDLRCPACGILTPDLRRGRELEVHAIEVDDPVPETP